MNKKLIEFKPKKRTQLEKSVRQDLDTHGQGGQRFLEAFVENGGNATEAALKAFNCKNRATASAMGHNYLKRVKNLAAVYLESKGQTYGKLMNLAISKAEESKTPEWWDRLMKLSGYGDFIGKNQASATVNIMNVQKELENQYVTEADPELPEEDELFDLPK